MINIEIDKLTHSIENAVTGDSFPTEVLLLENSDLKQITEKEAWSFDWKSEASKTDRQVYKLVIIGDSDSIQGLVSLSDKNDHILLQLIENAPLNLGKEKIYNGVAGNLFAFACKMAFDKGYDGFVGFISKSQLVEHYQKTLGAVHLGGLRMAIFTQEATKLVKQYFQNI
jgi:hypothetical protein